LMENKIPYNLFSKLPSEKLNTIKLDYLDFNLINKVNSDIPEKLKDKKIEEIYFKGSKITLGRGKVYSSKWSYLLDIPQENFEIKPQQLVDKNLENLWSDEEYLLFLTKDSS